MIGALGPQMSMSSRPTSVSAFAAMRAVVNRVRAAVGEA